ncbi:MAG TPA: O-antigen ligase family protein [Methylocella sp.]|nr:O-antigen ligase family protein [Methylocella sp.]
MALALLAWMLHAPSKRSPIVWNSVYILLFLYIMWATVTLLWAPDLIAGKKKLVSYCIGLNMLFLIVNQVTSLKAVDGFMRVMALVGWTMVIVGSVSILDSGFQFGERLKIVGMNENALGYYFTVLLPGAIWPVLRSSGLMRLLHMALSIMFIIGGLILILASGSRGSSLSLVVMLLAFWFWKPLRPWGIVGAMLVAGTVLFAPFLLDSLNNRLGDVGGSEVGGRDLLWTAGLHLILDYPLIGVGVGNGVYELPRYVAAVTSHFDKHDFLAAHNPLIEVTIDLGFIGLLMFIAILVSALKQFIQWRRDLRLREGPIAAYFPIVLVSVAGYFASFFKDGGLDLHPTYILVLGLLVVPRRAFPRDGLAANRREDVLRQRAPTAWVRSPAALSQKRTSSCEKT